MLLASISQDEYYNWAENLKMENKKLELEKLQNEIDSEITKVISIDGRSAFPDGIINIEKYLSSDVKIMWILKEPNSSEELNWRDEIGNLRTDTGTKYGWSGTFNPIVYVSFGILNNQNWGQIPYTNENPEIIEVLKSIAFINVKKTPGESVAFDNEIHEYHSKNKDTLLKQIKAYEPNVIICGNTFQYIGDDLKNVFSSLEFEHNQLSGMSNHQSSEIMIIDAFHPNARKNKEIYCDYIIDSVIQWKNKIKN